VGRASLPGCDWVVRGKDAGSGRIHWIRARLRTPHRAAQRGPAAQRPFRRALLTRKRPRLRLRAGAARDDLRDAVGAHRHAVEDVRGLHRPLLVRDDDELRAVGVAAEQLDEAADVRVVERGLDLVEEVERARPREEEREEERDRAERLLAAESSDSRVTFLPAGRARPRSPARSSSSSGSVERSGPRRPGRASRDLVRSCSDRGERLGEARSTVSSSSSRSFSSSSRLPRGPRAASRAPRGAPSRPRTPPSRAG
jgi:hypothetical protein